MRAEIPYAYSETTYDRRNARRTRSFGVSYNFDIPEISAADAPIALCHSGFRGRGSFIEFGPGRVFQNEVLAVRPLASVRAFHCGLYEPLRDISDGNIRYLTAENIGELKEWLLDVPCVSAHKAADAAGTRLSKPSDEDFYGRCRNYSHGDVNKLARELIAIDGVVHRRTSEPVYSFEGNVLTVAPFTETMNLDGVFRLDEKELLLDAVAAELGPHARFVAEQQCDKQIHLREPLFLSAEVRDPAIVRAANSLCEIAGYYLERRSKAEMMAYDDLRVAIKAQDSASVRDERRLSDMTEAMAKILDTFTFERETDVRVDRIRKSLAIFKERERCLEDAPDFSALAMR